MIKQTLCFCVDVFSVIIIVLRPLVDMILDVSYRIVYGGTKLLPPINNKILLMSATELAEKIRRREHSAVEVMEAYICRIKEVQPIVNAYTDERFEEALADAREVDKMLEAGVKTEGELAETKPLLGVPFSCKEIVGVKGLYQTWAFEMFKDRKAPRDSYVTAQYRRAGAIPVVVTNIPTMSVWWDTSNRIFGATKNPYDNNRTAGGSSGGEAALIASAGSVIGIGNDLAGSIRIPSSFCGVYGHKPSRGIISNELSWPELPNLPELARKFDCIMSTGPMCRYAEDLNILVKVLCGDDCQKLRLDEGVDFHNVDIYYIEEFPGFFLSATQDVKDSVRKAVKYFVEKYDATATKLEIEELKDSIYIWQSKLFESGGRFRCLDPDKVGFTQETLEILKCTLGTSPYNYRVFYHASLEFQEESKFYEKCIGMYNVIEEKLSRVLDGNAILILPVHPEPAPYPIVTLPKFKNLAYTCIFNALGLPATAVPAGQSKNGLPIGLQIVAKKYSDHLTLAAALELNRIFGGWKDPSAPLST